MLHCGGGGGGVQHLGCILLFTTSWTAALQTPLSFTVPGVCSNSCPLSQWCYLTILSSAAPFSFCLQFFPSSGCFPVSWLFATGGQSRTSALASVLPMSIQGWFPLGLTGWIFLQSRVFSRVFSNTNQKHQCFGTQPSLWLNSHIHTWIWESVLDWTLVSSKAD